MAVFIAVGIASVHNVAPAMRFNPCDFVAPDAPHGMEAIAKINVRIGMIGIFMTHQHVFVHRHRFSAIQAHVAAAFDCVLMRADIIRNSAGNALIAAPMRAAVNLRAAILTHLPVLVGIRFIFFAELMSVFQVPVGRELLRHSVAADFTGQIFAIDAMTLTAQHRFSAALARIAGHVIGAGDFGDILRPLVFAIQIRAMVGAHILVALNGCARAQAHRGVGAADDMVALAAIRAALPGAAVDAHAVIVECMIVPFHSAAEVAGAVMSIRSAILIAEGGFRSVGCGVDALRPIRVGLFSADQADGRIQAGNGMMIYASILIAAIEAADLADAIHKAVILVIHQPLAADRARLAMVIFVVFDGAGHMLAFHAAIFAYAGAGAGIGVLALIAAIYARALDKGMRFLCGALFCILFFLVQIAILTEIDVFTITVDFVSLCSERAVRRVVPDRPAIHIIMRTGIDIVASIAHAIHIMMRFLIAAGLRFFPGFAAILTLMGMHKRTGERVFLFVQIAEHHIAPATPIVYILMSAGTASFLRKEHGRSGERCRVVIVRRLRRLRSCVLGGVHICRAVPVCVRIRGRIVRIRGGIRAGSCGRIVPVCGGIRIRAGSCDRIVRVRGGVCIRIRLRLVLRRVRQCRSRFRIYIRLFDTLLFLCLKRVIRHNRAGQQQAQCQQYRQQLAHPRSSLHTPYPSHHVDIDMIYQSSHSSFYYIS